MARGVYMAGRKIEDHGFWAGSKSKDSVFPKGVHTKEEHSAMSAGAVDMYEDTTERIKETQNMADGKLKSHKMKPSHRN